MTNPIDALIDDLIERIEANMVNHVSGMVVVSQEHLEALRSFRDENERLRKELDANPHL